MKIIKLLSVCMLVICNGCKQVELIPNIRWNKASVNSLYNYDNGNYNVGLGISASAYYLYNDQQNYDQILKVLKESYNSNKVVEVGYTSTGSDGNRIVAVKIKR